MEAGTMKPEETTEQKQPKPKPNPTGSVEVDFEQAKAEAEQDNNVKPQAAPEEDALDTLVPKAEPKTWAIGPEADRRQYVQRPLSFISKMQWFALIGEVVDEAMSGSNAMSVNSLLAAPQGRGGNLTMADFADADTFVQAVGKLLVHAPDFLEKSFCIWLGVPDYEHEIARVYMALPPEEGGLSDDQGMEIIEVFIDQNYEALDSFFRERLGQLRDRVEARQKKSNESQSSRR